MQYMMEYLMLLQTLFLFSCFELFNLSLHSYVQLILLWSWNSLLSNSDVNPSKNPYCFQQVLEIPNVLYLSFPSGNYIENILVAMYNVRWIFSYEFCCILYSYGQCWSMLLVSLCGYKRFRNRCRKYEY